MLQPQLTVESTHYFQKNEKNRKDFLKPTFDLIVYVTPTPFTPVDSFSFIKRMENSDQYKTTATLTNELSPIIIPYHSSQNSFTT